MRFFLTLVSVSALLSACGGGGGSTPGEGSTPTAEPVALTQANYVGVAQEALSSFGYFSTTSSLASDPQVSDPTIRQSQGTVALADSLVSGSQVSDPTLPIRFGQAQLSKLQDWFVNVPGNGVTSQTQACDGGGNITRSVNDLNGNNQVDVGDAIFVSAVSCLFQGETVNGKLVMTFDSITENSVSYPRGTSINVQFNNLVLESTSGRTVSNGSVHLSTDSRTAYEDSLGFSTQNFTLGGTYGNLAYSQTLSNYVSSSVTIYGNTDETTSISTSGTLTSSALESKSIAIKTLAPFIWVNSQTYPRSGQVLISGAVGSTVRITVTSPTMMLIELDADANGSYEKSTSKSWN